MADRLRRAGSFRSPTSRTATAATTNGAMTSGVVIGGRVLKTHFRASLLGEGARRQGPRRRGPAVRAAADRPQRSEAGRGRQRRFDTHFVRERRRLVEKGDLHCLFALEVGKKAALRQADPRGQSAERDAGEPTLAHQVKALINYASAGQGA